jgi:rare lipoprotein A
LPEAVAGRRCPAAAVRLLLTFAACVSGCSLPTRAPEAAPPDAVQYGIASWYGPGFHGNPTSSGEIYDQFGWTAAHRTLPLGTPVAVTNLDNGKRIEVRINDRGPFVKSRLVDLSYAAAEALDMIGPGTAPVRLDVLDPVAASLGPPTYAVQVGAFADHDHARELQERLAGRFEDVHVVPFESREGSYYRVRLGRLDTAEEAQQLARLVAPLGLPTIVVEEFAKR